MSEKKNYITPKGLQKILDEIEYLSKVDRPEVTRVVTWAASLGDRSENADYQYGKKRLREIDKRLAFLHSRLNDIHVVDPTSIKSLKVQFGATVKVIDESGIERTFAIVGEDEICSIKSYISWKSPIGRSLIGKNIGDNVEIKVPKGLIELEIISVEYLDL
jgi:transcription elongation factor GreB